MKLPFDMKFTLTFEFKDGRMRIGAPHILELRQEATLGDVFIKNEEILCHKGINDFLQIIVG